MGQTFFAQDSDKHNVLLVTRGHSFQRDPFFAMFDDNPDIAWSGVEHPAAQLMFTPEAASHFDCYVLYDMPGIEFKRHGDGVPTFHPPPAFFTEGLEAMLEQGVPLVILHHACASWPAWPLWADIVGARFRYACPDDGYRMDVEHIVSPLGSHPITEGVAPFLLRDELYLFEVDEDNVVPLLASDYDFVSENFYSASLALAGKMNSNEGWQHGRGSRLAGWVKHCRNSPIVYLQPGDGPQAYANPSYRQLLRNAINWACSEQARQWARERALSPGTTGFPATPGRTA